MQNNCLNDGRFPSLGGTSKKGLFNLELKDLLEDECEQIVMSTELFKAFVESSKCRKNYNGEKIYSLFKYLVYLYNDTMEDTNKFGALTYLERNSKILDFLEISNIMELSIDQLNILLDLDDGKSVKRAYERIQKKRHELTENEFEVFNEMLRNAKSSKINIKEAKKVYKYIAALYNANTILQDNVSYKNYLEAFSRINMKSIMSMRMCQIIDMFKIQNINYENVNEEKNY